MADKAEAFVCRFGITSAGDSRGGTIQLRSINKNSTHLSEIQSKPLPARSVSGLRPDEFHYQVDVRWAGAKKQSGDGAESQSVESEGSEQMIIRRNVDVQVSHELA